MDSFNNFLHTAIFGFLPWLMVILIVLQAAGYLMIIPNWLVNKWRQWRIIDWKALHHREVQIQLQNNRKRNAIKAYRKLTGQRLPEAVDAIEYAIAIGLYNKDTTPKSRMNMPSDAGIHDLVAQGKIQKAIDIYQQFTGVHISNAKEVVQNLRIKMRWKRKTSPSTSNISDAGIRDLIEDEKIEEAVNIYQQFAGVDKFSAHEAIKQIENEMRLDISDVVSFVGSHLDTFTQKQSESKEK